MNLRNKLNSRYDTTIKNETNRHDQSDKSLNYTERQLTLFSKQGIKFQKGKKVIPKGVIVVNEETINFMAKSFYVIDPSCDINAYASMINQNVRLFNKLICAFNITNGTKAYKNL
jgi:hypothetical protein